MSGFADVWVSPGDLICVCGGGRVVASDFRDLSVGALITINSCLLRPECVAGRVVERLDNESLSCGGTAIVLTRYLVEWI